MLSLLAHLAVLAFTALGVQALPSPVVDASAAHVDLLPRDGVTTLSAATLAGLAPYTQFARAAYCDSSIVQGWKCGRAFVLVVCAIAGLMCVCVQRLVRLYRDSRSL